MMIDRLADYHIHSTYNDHSDCDLTIRNVIDIAGKRGLKKIAFTEHVRRTSDWIERYLNEIELYARDSSLEVLRGFEAKILSDGTIDCPDEYRGKYFLIASFHTLFGEKERWISALKSAIRDPTVDVIGHLAPEPNFSLSVHEIDSIANEIALNHKIVEINSKYLRPPLDWISSFKRARVKFHLGSDAHSLNSVGGFNNINHLIAAAEE